MNRLQPLLAPSCLAQPRDFAKYFGWELALPSKGSGQVLIILVMAPTLDCHLDFFLETILCKVRLELVFSLHLFREARGHDLSSAAVYVSCTHRNTSGILPEQLRNTSGTPPPGIPHSLPEHLRNSCGIPPSGTPAHLQNLLWNTGRPPENLAQPPGTPPEYLRDTSRNTFH